MMMPDYKLSVIKKIVRSVFPRYALKFDKVVDADNWIEVIWQIEVPARSKNHYDYAFFSKKLQDGRKMSVRLERAYFGDDFDVPTPIITSPLKMVILNLNYQHNGGKHSRITMTLAVEPVTE
jgi:hypothetical protein